LIEEKHIK